MLGRQTAFLHNDAGIGCIAQSSGTSIWGQKGGRKNFTCKGSHQITVKREATELNTSILPAYSANFPTLLSSSQHCLVEVLSPSDSNVEESKD